MSFFGRRRASLLELEHHVRKATLDRAEALQTCVGALEPCRQLGHAVLDAVENATIDELARRTVELCRELGNAAVDCIESSAVEPRRHCRSVVEPCRELGQSALDALEPKAFDDVGGGFRRLCGLTQSFNLLRDVPELLFEPREVLSGGEFRIELALAFRNFCDREGQLG